MALLGIDFGLKKIGIALSEGEIASPQEIWYYKDLPEIIGKTKQYCSDHKINILVIGMPEKSTGSNLIIQNIKIFSDELKKSLDLKIIFEPEVYTTKTAQLKLREAGKSKKRRSRDDDVAAALILQSFMERQNGSKH